MFRSAPVVALVALVLLVFSCGRADERASSGSEEKVAAAGEATSMLEAPPAPPSDLMSSSAARVEGDTSRRFVRTADLRFRVKDVVQATYAIEDLVATFGGHVQHTELSTRVDHRYTTPISADSLLETTKYTVMNRATLRVPVARLDTALKSLARFVDFLDHRTVDAEDVRLLLLSNRMAQERIARHQERMEGAIDEQGRKLRETAGAEDRLLDRQEQADEARLSNLGLEDRIAYSTITLDLYQRQSTRHELLPDERNIERYEPGFFSELVAALASGWDLLMELVLMLARSWSVLLVILGGFLLLRRLVRGKPTAK